MRVKGCERSIITLGLCKGIECVLIPKYFLQVGTSDLSQHQKLNPASDKFTVNIKNKQVCNYYALVDEGCERSFTLGLCKGIECVLIPKYFCVLVWPIRKYSN